MSTSRARKTTAVCAALLLSMACAAVSSSASADDSCGLTLLPGLDGSGTFANGEVLDLTDDGIYVGSSEDAQGIRRAVFWVDGVPQQVPDGLDDAWLGDVTESHLAVGQGYDPATDVYRGYVLDLDTGSITWLPGIGGEWSGARRLNEHGVAVGDGASRNGTAHPLRWSPPYTSAERLPKVGGNRDGVGAWAAGNNDHGDMVGSAVRGRLTPDKRDYGGLDARDHYSDLDAIAWSPGPSALEEAGPYSHTWDLNNEGTAVGFADIDAIQATVAAYWTNDRTLHRMGSVLPDMWQSLALGVSEGGWATGAVEIVTKDDEITPHSFVWTGTGNLLMVPSSAGSWDASTSFAHGVSDVRDEITGWAFADGANQPAVWRCASTTGVDPT